MTIVIPVWVLVLMIVLIIPIAALIIFGLLDVYAMLRLRKNNGIDKSAIMGNWISLKWMFASQSDNLLRSFPWIGQDLSQVLGVKKVNDEGRKEYTINERIELLKKDKASLFDTWGYLLRCTEQRLGGTRDELEISLAKWVDVELGITLDTLGIPRYKNN